MYILGRTPSSPGRFFGPPMLYEWTFYFRGVLLYTWNTLTRSEAGRYLSVSIYAGLFVGWTSRLVTAVVAAN